MTDIIAHRGASSDALENTIAAYDLAIEAGADALEVDLRLTADHRLVALHDATLARTTGDPRAVADVTLDELMFLRRAVRPPRLSKLLRRYGHRAWLLLELKDPTPAMERRVLRALDQLPVHVVIQSFDERSLHRLRQLSPTLSVAPLIDRRPLRMDRWLDRMAALKADAVGVRFDLIDRKLIHAAAQRGLGVRAWTVNDPDDAAILAGLGVAGIITDKPGLLRASLRERHALAA